MSSRSAGSGGGAGAIQRRGEPERRGSTPDRRVNPGSEVILRYAGALVTTATRARDALVVLERVIPNIVITDIGMPEHDGFWLLGEIRAIPRLTGLPVVALTAHVHPDERARVLVAGFQAYLPKPVETRDLVATVARHIGKGSEQ